MRGVWRRKGIVQGENGRDKVWREISKRGREGNGEKNKRGDEGNGEGVR